MLFLKHQHNILILKASTTKSSYKHTYKILPHADHEHVSEGMQLHFKLTHEICNQLQKISCLNLKWQENSFVPASTSALHSSAHGKHTLQRSEVTTAILGTHLFEVKREDSMA